MAGISTDIKKAFLQWIFKQTTFLTPPATLFFSLHSGDPGDVGANELSPGTSLGYARAELDPDPDTATNVNYTNISAMGNTQIINNQGTITWPVSGSLWNGGNPIPFWALWTQATNGLFILSGTISGPPLVIGTTGVTLKALTSQLIVTIN